MRESSSRSRQRAVMACIVLALISSLYAVVEVPRQAAVETEHAQLTAAPPDMREPAPLPAAAHVDVRGDPDPERESAHCPDGSYHGDVSLDDSNFAQLKQCARVLGDLHIDVSERRDLAGLEALRSIEGSLEIAASRGQEGASLESLRGLDALREVSGDVSLGPRGGAGSLLSLSGLGSLRSVRTLRVQNLPELNDLRGLSALVQAERVEVVGCSALESLLGLDALREIRGRLLLARNDALSSLSGAPRLHTLNELVVDENASLRTLQGLSAQVERLTALTIEHNAKLTSLLGSEALVHVQNIFVSSNPRLLRLAYFQRLRSLQVLEVADNPSLVELGAFPALAGSEQLELTLRNNGQLRDLRGLERVAHAFNVTISGASALTDLTGWNIQTVHNLITLSNNTSLTSLRGLERLHEVARLRVQANPRLTNLDALSGLRHSDVQLELYNNLALVIPSGLAAASE